MVQANCPAYNAGVGLVSVHLKERVFLYLKYEHVTVLALYHDNSLTVMLSNRSSSSFISYRLLLP